MRSRICCVAAVIVCFLAAGCGEPQDEPEVPLAPSFAEEDEEECPIPADYLVSDETELLDALSSASAGEVIGLDGYFGITSDFFLGIDDVTLTCATPGSGLYVEAEAVVGALINVPGKRVTVDRLVLDGTGATSYTYYAVNNGAAWRAEDVLFTNNSVICAPSGCTLLAGVAGAVFTDNYFEAPGSATGIHLQGQGVRGPDGWIERRTDGSRVERNVVVATLPQPTCEFCAGIRPRDGKNLVVSHNTVIGPWINSISTAMLYDSEVSGNRLEGGQAHGIALSRNANSPFSTVNNLFRGNRVSGSGDPGAVVVWACDNVFLGNNLKGNNLNGDQDIGIWLRLESGNNTVLSNKNVIVEEGDFDCDGDGLSDPNLIAGSGPILRGIHFLGQTTGATSSHGELQ